MPEQKRVRRTPEQIAAAIDAQIEALEGAMQETCLLYTSDAADD